MSGAPRIFVSFSSRDNEIVRRLVDALRRCGLDVWDYSRRGSELEPGRPLQGQIEEQIRCSDVFIPLLTLNSTQGEAATWPLREIELAVAEGFIERGRLLPLVSQSSAPVYEGPATRLKPLMRVRIDTRTEDAGAQAEADGRHKEASPGGAGRVDGALEDAVRRICQVLGWPYTPPYLGDSRLPFRKKFNREARDLFIGNALYTDLMAVVDQALVEYDRGNWEEAHRRIAYFIGACAFTGIRAKPYYPLIARGVCELHMGRFPEAERTFSEALRHPDADENAPGGLGQVYFAQKRYREALGYFREAQRLCPRGEEWEARFDVLAAETALGVEPTDIAVLEEEPERALAGEDRIRLTMLSGIILHRRGRHADAVELFRRLIVADEGGAAAVVYCARSLDQLGCLSSAIDLLQDKKDAGDTAILHHLASLLIRNGRTQEALKIYREQLCAPERRTRQILIDCARVLRHLDERLYREEITLLCRKVLDPLVFGLPSTPGDFFYCGFAQFLLGGKERAEYDYERSAGYCRDRYESFP